jgi:DNA-binding MarR family transcriptional regulator
MPQEISRLINRISRTVHCLQFAQGLNPAQWEALRFLSQANRYSRNPTALAEYLRTTKGTASQTLRCLESKGFVRRVGLAADRRTVRIDLTESGQAVLLHDPLRCLEKGVTAVGEEVEPLRRALARMAAGLERGAGFKPFGLCSECTHFCKNEAPDNADPHRCGFNGDTLSAADAEKICVNHRAGATTPPGSS